MVGLKSVDGISMRPRREHAQSGRIGFGGKTVCTLTLLLLVAGACRCCAQDGSTLLHKMADAYQHLSTYDIHSNVDVWMSGGGRTLTSKSSSNLMQFKRPNKLVLVVYNNSPTGTRSIYSDGTTLTVYDAVPNHYFSGPTAPNMESMINLLMARAQVSAQLDPLYFLCTSKLPPKLTELKAAGNTTLNGRLCYVVTGVIRSTPAPAPKARQNSNAATANVMHWTWYIDQQTFLLNKLEGHSDTINVTGSGR